MIGVLVVLLAAVLPAGPRSGLIRLTERVERRTGVSSLLLATLIIYWVARLLYAPRAFISLITHP